MKPVFGMTKKNENGKPVFELCVEKCDAEEGLEDTLLALGYTQPYGRSAHVCKITVTTPAQMDAARAPLVALKNAGKL